LRQASAEQLAIARQLSGRSQRIATSYLMFSGSLAMADSASG
jgi:hypothetical protein